MDDEEIEDVSSNPDNEQHLPVAGEIVVEEGSAPSDPADDNENEE
jgi:hypothetical protein